MPPAAGLRPNPAPLKDQGKGTRGGDLLPARHKGSQTGHRGRKAEERALHPGTRPGRDEPAPREDHHQHEAREGKSPQVGPKITVQHSCNKGRPTRGFSGHQGSTGPYPQDRTKIA